MSYGIRSTKTGNLIASSARPKPFGGHYPLRFERAVDAAAWAAENNVEHGPVEQLDENGHEVVA